MKRRLLNALAGLFILAAFWSTPALAEWRRAESPNFILYGESSEGRLRERILLLEEFHRLLGAATGVNAPPAPNKMTVYIVSGNNDLRRIGNVSANVAGVYIANSHGIAAFADAAAPADDNEVLFHEYVHHFMWQYAPNAYPAWFVEGFAEYYMTTRFERNEVHTGRGSAIRARSVLDGLWIPMESVLFESRQGLSVQEIQRYYAQSWMLVHYFHSEQALKAKLRAYLLALRQGADPREAFERETGMNVATLTRTLRSYFGDGRIPYTRWTRPSVAPPPVTVTVLPRSANDLLLYEAALRIGSANAANNGLLDRVRSAAARHGEDIYARRVLAHAEVMFGDRAAGGRMLEGLLQAAPNDAELLYLMGMRYLNEAEKGNDWEGNARQAARWFTRAHRADGNHYQTLYRYAQSLRGTENFDSENTANILVLAQQLAPQVEEIRMNTAAMLISRSDFALAEALLAPLAATPHNESLAQAAQALLERARRGRAAPPAAAPAAEPATPSAHPPGQ
jgi:hypothetical protein